MDSCNLVYFVGFFVDYDYEGFGGFEGKEVCVCDYVGDVD